MDVRPVGQYILTRWCWNAVPELTRILIIGRSFYRRRFLVRVINLSGELGPPVWVTEREFIEWDATPVDPVRCYEPRQMSYSPRGRTPWDPGDV